ncbi:MAG: glycosyltransferase [Sphingobacteriaceae bacterium]|nr:MAG: glycosyltransferase [Sphingobacteriaceae bacterium]
MRLLHITASMDPKLGGVCQALKTMIQGLKSFKKIENEIVSFDNPDASFISQNNCKINALGAGKGPWFYNADYFSWLVIHMQEFDVVILHGLWNYQGYGLIKALRLLKKNNTAFSTKLFVMPHGMLDPYFQKAGGRKLKAIRNWFYWKLIEKNVVNEANGLLFTCEAELLLARKTFSPYQPKKELVVGLGVEEPPAAAQIAQEAFLSNHPTLKTNPYLLFISRIHAKKGVDLLLDAYQNYNKNLQNQSGTGADNNASFIGQKSENLTLVIAGPGIETPYGQKIYADAGKLNQAEEKVIFPGMLTGDAKWAAFYNCEAFILPSHQENFGIAVVEALACGKPVLISNQINIHTEISNANAGIIADDTKDGTKQLLEKWNNLSPQEKQQMSLNARKCYEKYFAVAPASKNLIDAVSEEKSVAL